MTSETTRNSERTRREILTAARDELKVRGMAMSLQHVATTAGISKSGLLHHFASKNELLLAVLEDYLANIRQGVRDYVDLSENRPGKTLRAYVRALCEPESALRVEFANFADISMHLGDVDGVEALEEEDNLYWREFLANDGLDPDRILLVRYAAEGLASASCYDASVVTDDLPRALPMLLRMTEE